MLPASDEQLPVLETSCGSSIWRLRPAKKLVEVLERRQVGSAHLERSQIRHVDIGVGDHEQSALWGHERPHGFVWDGSSAALPRVAAFGTDGRNGGFVWDRCEKVCLQPPSEQLR